MLLKLFTDYHHSDALRRRFHHDPNAVCDEYAISAADRKILQSQDRKKLEARLAAEAYELFDKGSHDGNDPMYPPPGKGKGSSAQYPPPKKKGAGPQYPPPKKKGSGPQYPPPKQGSSAQYPPPKKRAKKKVTRKKRR